MILFILATLATSNENYQKCIYQCDTTMNYLSIPNSFYILLETKVFIDEGSIFQSHPESLA